MNGCLVNPAEMYKKEIAVLTEELARVKVARQELETELARRELEQAELKKGLDEERDLRKRVEKNADERINAARQDYETELAKLRDSLAKRELEQAELKKDLEEERLLRKQLATVQEPNVQVGSPSIPNGIYVIKNRTGNIYWSADGYRRMERVTFWKANKKVFGSDEVQVNKSELSPIIPVLKG